MFRHVVRKRWVDDILKWCDMTLQQASHHAQDRMKWRNLIAGPYGSWVLEPQDKKKKKKKKAAVSRLQFQHSAATVDHY